MSRTVIGEISFPFIYGIKVVILAKIGLVSSITSVENLEGNEEGLAFDLDLLEEKREHSDIRLVGYQ